MGNSYDAFISYARQNSEAEASALQSGLQSFGKKWTELRALRVFRDDSAMSASSDLWRSILVGLESSRWLILILSPAAAASPWVDREVAWWLQHRDPDSILLVRDEGQIAWDNTDLDSTGLGRFSEETDCVPPSLLGAVTREPRWIDLSWYDATDSLKRRDPRFNERIADLSAAIQGRARDDVVGAHVAQARRTKRLAVGAIGLLTLLLIVSLVAAYVAVAENRRAQEELVSRIAGELAANAILLRNEIPRLAALSALAAHEIRPSEATQRALASVAQANGTVEGSIHLSNSSITAVDGDGRLIAASIGDRKVHILDAETLTPTDVIDYPAEVAGIFATYLPRTSRFFVQLRSGELHVLDVETNGTISRHLLVDFEIDQDPPTWQGLVVLDNQQFFATVTADGMLFTWDETLDATNVARPLPGCTAASGGRTVTASGDLSFYGKGTLSLICSTKGQDFLVRFDLKNGSVQTRAALPEGTPPVSSLLFLNGRYLLGTHLGVYLLDESLTIVAYPLGGIVEKIVTMRFDGFSVLVSSSRATYLLDGDFHELRLQDPIGARVQGGPAASLSVSRAQSGVIIGQTDGTISVLNGAQGSPMGIELPAAGAMAFDPDGDLVSTSGTPMAVEYLTVRLPSGTLEEKQDAERKYALPVPSFVNDLTISEKYIATVGFNQDRHGTLTVWNRRTGALIGQASTDTRDSIMNAIAISHDESMVAVTDPIDRSLSLYSLPELTLLQRANTGPRIIAPGFSSDDGAVVALTTTDTYERSVMRMALDGTIQDQVIPDADWFSISPDGLNYAVTRGNVLTIHALETHATLLERAFEEPLGKVAWSSTGDLLAVSSGRSNILIVDTATLAEKFPRVSTANGNPVYRFELWQGLSERNEATAPPRLAVLSSDDSGEVEAPAPIAVIDLADGAWKATMCRISGGSPSESEWLSLVGSEVRYVDLCAGWVAEVGVRTPYVSKSVRPSGSPVPGSSVCGPTDEELADLIIHPEARIVSRTCSDDGNWAHFYAEFYYQGNPNDVRQGHGVVRYAAAGWTVVDWSAHSLCVAAEDPELPPELLELTACSA